MRLAFLVLLLCSTAAQGQSWPSRPVRVVVPLSPGGFADTPVRLIAPRLSEQLGRQVFIENRPGAGGTIGADAVAKSNDGHTLLVTGSTHLISSHLYRSLPYDALKDFTPVSMLVSGPYVLVVNPHRAAVSTVRELIEHARRQPGAVDYASSGNGSSQHLVGALFNSMANVKLNHIPYKGSGPAMQDLLAAQVGVSFAGVPNVLTHVRSGKLRALAVTTTRRWSELPEVPTLAEAGVPGYEATLWLSLSGPAALPPAVAQRLHAEIGKALQEAEVQRSLRAAGVEPVFMSPEELNAFTRAEHEKWGRVVRETGATVN